ncbi:MAG: hypothetical protein JXM70_16430 [Pirellulales bacterium]|nr:hypothetical protein [Pirellulales bacterium]
MGAKNIALSFCIVFLVVTIIALSTILFFTQSPDSIEYDMPRELSYEVHGDPIVGLTPVVVVDKSTDMTVSFYFTNTSTKPIGYWTPWIHAGPGLEWNWNLIDCKTGKILLRPNTNIALTKESVNTLHPDDSALVKIALAGEFSDLQPGLYELRTKCSIDKRSPLCDIGMTPMQFDKTIMFINVIAEK